jgi:membrane protein implicated in regulation of membrane protease activity
MVLLVLAIAGLFILPDPWRLIFLGAVVVFEVGEVYFWLKFLARYRVTTGAEGMIGELGEVIESCEPEGRVRLRGEIWNARSRAPARAGSRVKVSAVENLTLVVDPESGAETG